MKQEQTTAEYIREARKRAGIRRRDIGTMMARLCEMQQDILPMWRLSARAHMAALTRVEQGAQFCTWEDSRLIAEVLGLGQEGANRLLSAYGARKIIEHARHSSTSNFGGRVTVAIRRRDDPRSCAFVVARREELPIIYERHQQDRNTLDTPALTLDELRAKDWCLCYAAAEAPLYTTWRANLVGKGAKDGYALVCVQWRGHVLDLN